MDVWLNDDFMVSEHTFDVAACDATKQGGPVKDSVQVPWFTSAPAASLASYMVRVSVTVAPGGLHPLQACLAWHLRVEQGYSWEDTMDEVRTVTGEKPKIHALRNAVQRVSEQSSANLPGQTSYANCGRKPKLTEEQVQAAVDFVTTWRHKRFCTCRYIIQELKLPVQKNTLARILNANGFFWKAVPKTMRLTKQEVDKRKVWVQKYGDKPASWWEANMNLVLDGVTLSVPPKALSGRQKHAAQRIGHMWMRKGEQVDSTLHTCNRYGVQLGTKVPLWGGFTGGGQFTLRLWTPRPKMLKTEWQKLVPALKRAVDTAESRAQERNTKRAKVWHDNEKFLLCPATYRTNGLELVRFPPNSGDLNPIETVWAELRKALAVREQEDLDAGRVLSVPQFKQRVAQILNVWSVPKTGDTHSFLQKLVRGMPKRLAKCQQNRYGRCGK